MRNNSTIDFTKREMEFNTRDWLPFEEAREHIRRLHISNQDTWREYVAGRNKKLGYKPENIPSRPDSVYENKGWISWNDWFGKDRLSTRKREYLSYEQARERVRQFGIKSAKEYFSFWKQHQPVTLPSHPQSYYLRKGWQSWSDFLGTKNIKNIDWRPFKEAKEYVQKLNLKSAKEFYSWGAGKLKNTESKPMNIPIHPHIIYKDKGWRGYGDFLGTENIAPSKKNFMDYERARSYVRTLRFKNRAEYERFWEEQRPGILPKNADIKYRESGWKDWDDFLGVSSHRSMGWRPYYEAEIFVHQLHLKNHREWVNYCAHPFNNLPRKPVDIPTDPYSVYAGKGWETWGKWLGTGNPTIRKISFRSYAEARVFASKLNLRNKSHWLKFVRGRLSDMTTKPNDIPSNPDVYYIGRGWIDWNDFLGTNQALS